MRHMMEPKELEQRLLAAFPDAQVEVVDLTGTQDHFQATIVAREFEGRSLMEQHRLVYQALGEAMQGAIHALALKTSAPK